MINAFKNCFLWRVVAYIAAHLAQWYDTSLLGRIGQFFARHYRNSVLKRIWNRYVERDSGVYTSIYGRFFTWLDRLCTRFGAWFMPVCKKSLVYRLYTGTKTVLVRLWTKYASDGIVGRLIGALGLNVRRAVLLCIGFYLPIDWLLRDVLKISALASIWDEAFFALSAAYIVSCRVAGKKLLSERDSHVSPLDLPILLFVALGLFLMCVNSPVFSIAVAGYRATVQYMLWFFVVIRLLEDDHDVYLLAGAVALTGLLMAFHGVYQYIVAAPIPAHWVSQAEAGVRTRAFSITGSPNILGAFLVMTAPIVAGVSYTFDKLWKKLFAWAMVCVMCVCLLVTFSRGAWFGMCISVVMFAIVYDRRIFAPLATAVPAVMFIPSIANRILFLFTDDFATASASGGRAERWAVGKELMESNPLFGFGLGRFGGAVAMQNQYLEVTEEFSYFYMDNYYLKIGTEMGYTGLVTFIILIAALVWLGLRCAVRAQRISCTVGAVSSGIFAGLCGIAAHCYFENIFEEPYMMALFWSLAAALMFYGYIRRRT